MNREMLAYKARDEIVTVAEFGAEGGPPLLKTAVAGMSINAPYLRQAFFEGFNDE